MDTAAEIAEGVEHLVMGLVVALLHQPAEDLDADRACCLGVAAVRIGQVLLGGIVGMIRERSRRRKVCQHRGRRKVASGRW